MRTGIANLPLHPGKCPAWLFKRMKNLSGAMSEIIIYEYGQEEFLKKLSDPYWFQAFSCVLGFDWHSSGVTTTVCGALKESIKPESGICVCGGKGRASRKTPEEIEKASDTFSLSEKKKNSLVYASKMSAKVDNTAIQDGYNLYHHVFLLTEKGKWCVIQQGMNSSNRYARRYHWLSDFSSFVVEPHSAICCDKKQKTLNMVAKESKEAQNISLDLVKERNISKKILSLPPEHSFELRKQTQSALDRAYEIQPENYEELLAIRGIGPKAVRALALVSQLIYGSSPSWEDPAKFSFAHGGKDGIPYPVNRGLMDSNIDMLKNAVSEAKLGSKDKIFAIRRLNEFL